MSLKKYFEIMTPQERTRAANSGQTNLNKSDILDKRSLVQKEWTDDEAEVICGVFYSGFKTPKENIENFKKEMPEYFDADTNNPFVDKENKRLILTKNNKLYWAYAYGTTHNRILGALVLNGINISLNILREWWSDSECLSEVLCLHYSPYGKGHLFEAESYDKEALQSPEIQSYTKFLLDKYNIESLGIKGMVKMNTDFFNNREIDIS